MATSMAQHDYSGGTINSHDVAFPVLEIAKQMIEDNRKGSVKNTGGDNAVTGERDPHYRDESNRNIVSTPLTVTSHTESSNAHNSSRHIDFQRVTEASNQACKGAQESIINTDTDLPNDVYLNQTCIQTAAPIDYITQYHPVIHTAIDGQNTQSLYNINCFQQPYPPMNYEQLQYAQQYYPMYAHGYQQMAQEQSVQFSNQAFQVQQFDQNILPTEKPTETISCVANGLCVETPDNLNQENIVALPLEIETPPISQAWSQGTPHVSSSVDESEIINEIKDKLKGSNLVRKVTIDKEEMSVTLPLTEIPPQDVNLAPPCFYKNVPPPSLTTGTTACTKLVHVANAAVATKPSGDKVIIPLDHNMYEVKIKGQHSDEMPADAVENAFKKESELYGNIDSPRPIQIKGSISDEEQSEFGDYATDASKSADSLSSRSSERDDISDIPGAKATVSETVIASVEQEKDDIKESMDDSIDANDQMLAKTEPEKQATEKVSDAETEETVTNTQTSIDSFTEGESRPPERVSAWHEEVERVDSVDETVNAPCDIENTAGISGNSVTVMASEPVTAPETPNGAAAVNTAYSEIDGQAIDTVNSVITNPYQQMVPDQQMFVNMQPYPENVAWADMVSTQPVQWYTQNQDGSYAQQQMESPIGECYHFNNAWYQQASTEPTSGAVTNCDDSSQFVTEPLIGSQDEQQQPATEEVVNQQQYPLLHVSEDGLVTVLLRHGVCLEMTTDKALRLVCHERKLVAALTADGTSACLIHPAAKLYQNSTTTDVDLYLARKVKIMTESTVFGNNFNTYSFDYSMINQCDGFAEFIDQSEDKSVDFLETDSGFFNFEVAMRTSEIVSRAYFEKYQTNGCKVIVNGVKIVQTDTGEVSVYSGPIKFLRLSPLKNILRLRSQFLEADIETNWNVKVRRGTHTLNASYLGLIISNGKIKACIDQKNKMQAFGLPDHRRIYLGQRLPQQRPGVPRQRYISLPQRRGEPEGDHWGYTRHSQGR